MSDIGDWIPSDGNGVLPASGQVALITVQLVNGQRECALGTANGAGGWQIVYIRSVNVPITGVIAWMPLPAAYKGDYPLG